MGFVIYGNTFDRKVYTKIFFVRLSTAIMHLQHLNIQNQLPRTEKLLPSMEDFGCTLHNLLNHSATNSFD